MIFTLLTIPYLLCIYFIIINCIVYKQRILIIDFVYSDNSNWKEDQKILDQVSYMRHLFTLATLRNPYKLYRTNFGKELAEYKSK